MTENEAAQEKDDFKISSRIKFISLRRILFDVGKNLSDLLGSRRIGIYLQGKEEGNWALAISREVSEKVEQNARVINHKQSIELKNAIEKQQICLLEEILTDDLATEIQDENLIIIPMCRNNEAIGLLLADFDAFASLTKRHLLQLELAAQIINTAIEKEFQSMQISQLKQQLNQSDDVSDNVLKNENFLHWLLKREIERSRRYGSKFAILSIRLDNLAHIVSQYGQETSKKAVFEIEDAIRHLIRKCDFFVHNGSDLFLCVSFEQKQAGAYVLAEKIRHRVKETVCVIKNNRITSTVSIGIAVGPEGNETTSTELINNSMAALKDAQSHGNRVRSWSSDQAL